MPWQNNTGGGGGPWGGGGGKGSGGGGGQSPWGRPSGGGGGGGNRQPPDIEEAVRRGQESLKKMLPGGVGGPKGILIIGVLLVAGWLATGFYQVEPNEQGVELVFGKLNETTSPGLQYNVPAPIGEVIKPRVTDVNQEQLGVRTGARSNRGQDSLMLTGDENIIDIQAVVFWQISDAGDYLFNVVDPEETVRNAAEAAIREIIGQRDFEFARTVGRGQIAGETQELVQSILDDYESGIAVTNVQIQKVDPPSQVIDAFRDVQAARADAERAINEATAYLNEVTQRAEGQAQQIIQASEAYKQERIAAATGDAERFISIYNEYVNEKEITKRRIYLQTMEEILSNMDKVLIDDSGQGAGSGVVPYLPLDRLTERRSDPVAPAGRAAGGIESQ
ncbi:MAG: FtsH protease activity modulator HflK [Alphaproteobacteria bacterium]|nr:FtsH protease activity modulator HflK [Alphaproteobacteria bacterium]